MNVGIAIPCSACDEPMTMLNGGVVVCLYHDGVQDQEAQEGKPHIRVKQDDLYDKYIRDKWERETGIDWNDKRLKKQ